MLITGPDLIECQRQIRALEGGPIVPEAAQDADGARFYIVITEQLERNGCVSVSVAYKGPTDSRATLLITEGEASSPEEALEAAKDAMGKCDAYISDQRIAREKTHRNNQGRK